MCNGKLLIGRNVPHTDHKLCFERELDITM
jgi:hypothetical protein